MSVTCARIFIILRWILNFVKKGLKKELDLIDLYEVLDDDSSALLGNKLQK